MESQDTSARLAGTTAASTRRKLPQDICQVLFSIRIPGGKTRLVSAILFPPIPGTPIFLGKRLLVGRRSFGLGKELGETGV